MFDTELGYKLKKKELMSWLSPEIDHFERARILKDIMVREGLSQREFVKKYNPVALAFNMKPFANTTVDLWLLWTRITREEYDKLIKKGYTYTKIRALLRDNKKSDIKKILKKPVLNYNLEKWIKSLNEFKYDKTKFYDDYTIDLLEKLVTKANYVIYMIEQNYKR